MNGQTLKGTKMTKELETKDGGDAHLFGGHRLEVRAFTEGGEFEGYGSVFNEIDSYGDQIVPGAFTNSLADHKSRGTLPAMLWQHDPYRPIGAYTEMKEDSRGLWVKGKLALDTQFGREAHSLLKMGALNGMSIGYRTREADKDNGIRTMREVELWEVSLVTFPANKSARVEGVKLREEIDEVQTLADMERFLKQTFNTSNRAATAIIARTKALIDCDRDDRAARAKFKAEAEKLIAVLKT